ncbi:type VII secretion integral membrane protein EccD [Streptomyces sp. NPDC048663]|uniref:type VII secretion integral membrane protein EccD n=1 Tax=Streptomyces sp. NPDC048663 TaxID=3155638 RepID=UPI003445AE05
MTTAVSAPGARRTVSTEVCRLTIAGPVGRADLAVPVTTPISTLLAMLMRHIPTDLGRGVGTWTLQRLGESPLDIDVTPQSAGLVHGDILYLRPADDPIPELEFDDVADGVANAVGAHRDRWRPELTRRLFHSLAALVLAGFAVVVAVTADGALVPVLYAIASIALCVGGALDQRRPADRTTLMITGLGAGVFSALTGVTALRGTAALVSPQAVDIMLGGGCTALMSAVLLALPRLSMTLTSTMLLTGILASVAGALSTAFNLDAASSIVSVAVVFFLLGHLAPRASLRLSRLRVPQLPRNADELQEDIDPQAEHPLRLRAAKADAMLTVVSITTGLLGATAFVMLARHAGWLHWLFALVLSAAALLRSKNLNGTWQRVPMALSGALGLLSVVYAWALGASPSLGCALLLALLVAAGALMIGAWRLPTTRLLPVWGHVADILEVVTALALLPLTLQLLHIYAYFRAVVS